MSDEEDRGTGSLIPSASAEIVARSTSLVRRGLNLLDLQEPTEDPKITELRERANAGDVAAQCNLGTAYFNGERVPKNDAQAALWYRKAAEQGSLSAQFTLGWLYANGWRDYGQAVHWYRKAAEQGFASAQDHLGVAYANGRGVPQDDAQAVHWYRKAAEQGHARAQNHLGSAYANGRGVAQDYAQAVQWYLKAAEQGYARAQSALGWLYSTGQGVPQDHVEAYKWESLAAARESGADQKHSAEARDQLFEIMTAAQIAEAERRAREWMEAFERRNQTT